MNPTDQIAEEAWDKIRDFVSEGDKKTEDFISLIKAAIGKAIEPLRDRCLDFDAEYEKGYTAGWEACDREREISAAQASGK